MDNLSQPAGAAPEREQNPRTTPVKTEVELAKEGAAKLTQSASEQVGATFETVKSNLTQVAQEAAGHGEDIFNQQKGRLAGMVNEYGQAAKAASERLHQEGHDALASRADEIASRLEHASTYLRESKLSEIYEDAQHFTRRRPEVVFGMMFAAGLLGARFLKASDRGAAIRRPLGTQGKESLPNTEAMEKGVPDLGKTY